MKLAILITCYNRKEKTLECLEELYCQKGKFEFDVYLVDDGSSDGTSEMIAELFPSINLIQADGSLYWNGGMRLAWEQALKNTVEYDFYCWLNDDVKLFKGAISRLLESYRILKNNGECVGAVVGAMLNSNDEVTYGGKKSLYRARPLKLKLLDTNSLREQKCDVINGNFVLVPHSSVQKIGILSDHYTHQMGDYDYSFRLNKAGMFCWMARGSCGYCELNSLKNTYRDRTLDFSKRLALLSLPNQIAPVDEWCYFVRKHAGFTWPLTVAKAKVRKFFPKLWIWAFH